MQTILADTQHPPGDPALRTLISMSDEERRGRRTIEIGPTGRTVAQNIARLRDRRNLTTRQLSAALERAGRMIPPSGITRMEKAERVVTADELVALASVLGVSPSALLLPLDDSPSSTVHVTGAGEVPANVAWDWADGKRPLRLPEDAESAMLEYVLWGRPPGRRRPRIYEKGERTPEQIAAIRQYWERLFARGDADPAVVKRLDPELWEGDGS